LAVYAAWQMLCAKTKKVHDFAKVVMLFFCYAKGEKRSKSLKKKNRWTGPCKQI